MTAKYTRELLIAAAESLIPVNRTVAAQITDFIALTDKFNLAFNNMERRRAHMGGLMAMLPSIYCHRTSTSGCRIALKPL